MSTTLAVLLAVANTTRLPRLAAGLGLSITQFCSHSYIRSIQTPSSLFHQCRSFASWKEQPIKDRNRDRSHYSPQDRNSQSNSRYSNNDYSRPNYSTRNDNTDRSYGRTTDRASTRDSYSSRPRDSMNSRSVSGSYNNYANRSDGPRNNRELGDNSYQSGYSDRRQYDRNDTARQGSYDKSRNSNNTYDYSSRARENRNNGSSTLSFNDNNRLRNTGTSRFSLDNKSSEYNTRNTNSSYTPRDSRDNYRARENTERDNNGSAPSSNFSSPAQDMSEVQEIQSYGDIRSFRSAQKRKEIQDDRITAKEAFNVTPQSRYSYQSSRGSRRVFERRVEEARTTSWSSGNAQASHSDEPMVDLVMSQRPTLPSLLHASKIRRPSVRLPVNLGLKYPTFESLGVHPKVLERLKQLNIKTPTEIQRKAIARLNYGENILILGETGSGKTLAYLLPMLNKLLADEFLGVNGANPFALILAPTQLLAQQIIQVISDINPTNSYTVGIPFRIQTITSLKKQLPRNSSSRKSVSATSSDATRDVEDKQMKMKEKQTVSTEEDDGLSGLPVNTILVTTPSKLLKECSAGQLKKVLGKVQCVIVDEMDEQLQGSSSDDLKEILDRLRERKYIAQAPFMPRIKDPSMLLTTRQFTFVSASVGRQNARWPFEFVKRKFLELRLVEASAMHSLPSALEERFVQVDLGKVSAKAKANFEINDDLDVEDDMEEETSKKKKKIIKVPKKTTKEFNVQLQISMVNLNDNKPSDFKTTLNEDFLQRFAHLCVILDHRMGIYPTNNLAQAINTQSSISSLLQVKDSNRELITASQENTTVSLPGKTQTTIVFCDNQIAVEKLYACLSYIYRDKLNVIPFHAEMPSIVRWGIITAARQQDEQLRQRRLSNKRSSKANTESEPISESTVQSTTEVGKRIPTFPNPLINPEWSTVIIATDILSRGIDVCNSPLIVQFSFPSSTIPYLHRAGRTARANHPGECITLYNQKQCLLARSLELASQGAIVSSPDALIADMLLNRPGPRASKSANGNLISSTRGLPLDCGVKISPEFSLVLSKMAEFFREAAKKVQQAKQKEQKYKEEDMANRKKNSEVVSVETWTSQNPTQKMDLTLMFDRNGNFGRRLNKTLSKIRVVATQPSTTWQSGLMPPVSSVKKKGKAKN